VVAGRAGRGVPTQLNLRIAGRRGESGGNGRRPHPSSERAEHGGVRRLGLIVGVEDQRVAEATKEAWYPGVFVGGSPPDLRRDVRLRETELNDVSIRQRLLLQLLRRGGQADPDVHLGDGDLKPQRGQSLGVGPVSLLYPEGVDLMHLPTDAVNWRALIHKA